MRVVASLLASGLRNWPQARPYSARNPLVYPPTTLRVQGPAVLPPSISAPSSTVLVTLPNRLPFESAIFCWPWTPSTLLARHWLLPYRCQSGTPPLNALLVHSHFLSPHLSSVASGSPLSASQQIHCQGPYCSTSAIAWPPPRISLLPCAQPIL